MKQISNHIPPEFTRWLSQWLAREGQFIIFGVVEDGHTFIKFEESTIMVETIHDLYQELKG